MAKKTTSQLKKGLTLEDRRNFLKLPLDERRRRMEVMAARMVRYYTSKRETKERELWQGGDIVDAS
jgi:hypothetical protein